MPTKTMKSNRENVNFLINKTILKDLLMQAYEEGWCGSKDLAESAADEIVDNYQKKAASQERKSSNRSVRHGSTRPVNVYYSEEALDSETVQDMYGSDEVAPASSNSIQEATPANVVYGAPASLNSTQEAPHPANAIYSAPATSMSGNYVYGEASTQPVSSNTTQLEFTLQEDAPEIEMEVESENIGTGPNTSAEEELVDEDYDENNEDNWE